MISTNGSFHGSKNILQRPDTEFHHIDEIEKEYKQEIHVSRIEKFLLKCSGTSIETVKEFGVQTEINKGVGIGAAVLFTGIFAAFSSGYAISYVFDEFIVWILFGTFWGVSIFNLDRFIVSSSFKTDFLSIGDFVQTISRIILAIGIAFTIALPLELKLFEDELLKQATVTELKKGLKELEEEKRNRYKEWFDEVNGNGKGKYKKEGEGLIAKPLRTQYENVLDRIEIEKNRIEQKIRASPNYFGLSGRYKAFKEIRKDDYINQIAWGITLLFILIESIPIIVKLTSPIGVYDRQLEFRTDYALAQLNKKRKKYNVDEHLKEHYKNRIISYQSITSKITSLVAGKAIEFLFAMVVFIFGVYQEFEINKIAMYSFFAYLLISFAMAILKTRSKKEQKLLDGEEGEDMTDSL